jgi:nicotinamide riboside kinase
MHPHSNELSITAIYIIGPSSTGKTTLCSALSKALALEAPSYITEVARKVMRSKGFTREHVGELEMQEAIMGAQLDAEMEGRVYVAQRAESQTLLSDRSAVDAIAYAILTSKNKEEAEYKRRILVGSPQFQLALSSYRQAIFILLTPVLEWLVDDGVRSMDDGHRCLVVFRQVLSELEIKYEEIGADMKDLSDRVEFVKRAANYKSCVRELGSA